MTRTVTESLSPAERRRWGTKGNAAAVRKFTNFFSNVSEITFRRKEDILPSANYGHIHVRAK